VHNIYSAKEIKRKNV